MVVLEREITALLYFPGITGLQMQVSSFASYLQQTHQQADPKVL